MADSEATAFWASRYAERDQVWSGKPNAALVDTAADLTPGRALDLGCGEGGDSVWLAEHGWQVTGVDIAPNAIERARAAATARGVDERITWLVEDLSSWTPPGPYDLVSACFLHSPVEFPRAEVLRRAATAISPGGHLLVVGHAESPPWSRHRHEDGVEHEYLTPAQEVAALHLDPSEWQTVICESRSRDATGPDGEQAVLDDGVVLLRH
jgi:cyclopropane fatty-acyl-phospholipid synthase-like methyltransferase